MELRSISGLTLRRAMFAVLLDEGRPLTVSEVVERLQGSGVTPAAVTKPPHMVIADMLAYQVRAGRVRRTARATYQVISSSISRSSQRRCRQWRERLLDQLPLLTELGDGVGYREDSLRVGDVQILDHATVVGHHALALGDGFLEGCDQAASVLDVRL